MMGLPPIEFASIFVQLAFFVLLLPHLHSHGRSTIQPCAPCFTFLELVRCCLLPLQSRAPTSQNEARASIGRGRKHVRDRTISHGRAHRENVANAGIPRPGSGKDDKEHQEHRSQSATISDRGANESHYGAIMMSQPKSLWNQTAEAACRCGLSLPTGMR